MTARAIGRQYSNAAFAVARRTDRVEEFGAQLQAFAELVAGHGDLRKALESGALPTSVKRDILNALLERTESVGDQVRRLLDLLVENDRLALLPLIADAYRTRAMEAAGVLTAELVTALPLGDDRQASLATALGQATGHRIEITGRVDESIIGGVVARVGSVVYDGSVVRQLERMRQQLAADA